MTKSRIFIFITIFFSCGILAASRFSLRQDYVFFLLAFLSAVFALSFLNKFYRACLGALFLFCFGLGILRLNFAQAPNEFAELLGSKQKLEGYIVEDIDVRQNKQLLTFLPNGSRQRILITTTLAQEYFYGDQVVVEGKLTEPKVFDDFDYPKYLERFNVYALTSYPKVLILKSHKGNWLKEKFLRLKAAFVKRSGGFLKEPENGLLMGILIGARKSLPQDLVENFNRTGTSHIIAVSGFNITIIIIALSGAARLLGRRFSFWLSLFFLAGFIIMAGAGPSVLRAGVMGVLLLLAMRIGRQYSVGPAIFFAAFLMLLINPKILFWDIGFQLSFAATLGLIYFMPLLDKLFSWWTEFIWLKQLLLATLAATVSTLPLILWYFSRLSVVAPLSNILILPVVPWVMLLGFLSFLPFVGAGLAYAAHWLLLYIIKTVSLLSSWEFSSLEIHISLLGFSALSAGVLLLYWVLKILARRRSKTFLDKPDGAINQVFRI